MCELFALSARAPVTISLSFDELARHGGETGPHADGWGVAYALEGDAFVCKEPTAAAASPLARFIQEADMRSSLALAHIRKATAGERTFANTQPFHRELGGRAHLFAHNGHVPAVFERMALGSFRPLGHTDSEHAFCALLERLEGAWRREQRPGVDERVEIVDGFATELRTMGPANFLYADSELLFVHAHRRPKEDDAEPDVPGLHTLARVCAADVPAERHGVTLRDAVPEEQLVYLAATVPLSDEPWRPMAIGELAVVRNGELVQTTHARR